MSEPPGGAFTVLTHPNMKLEELEALLTRFGVVYKYWGSTKNARKNTTNLLTEITHGESVLCVNAAGTLVRITHVVCVIVNYFTPEGKQLHLIEDRQVSKLQIDENGNPTVWQRGFHFIAEKISMDESAGYLENGRPTFLAVRKAVEEELQIKDLHEQSWRYLTTEHIPMNTSASYAGLQTIVVNYLCSVVISHQSFRQDGYIESGRDKDTIFTWMPGPAPDDKYDA